MFVMQLLALEEKASLKGLKTVKGGLDDIKGLFQPN